MKECLTARELIQYKLVRGADFRVKYDLQQLTLLCLDMNGILLFNARNNRKKILGDSYKSEGICNNKL